MERPRIVIDVSSSDEDTIYPRPSRAGPAISQSVKKGIKPRKSHNRRQKEGSPQPTRRRQGQKSSETEEEVKIEVKPKKKPDRFKLARELFGYLTLLDPRYKPFLKKSGFANSIQADQNSAFILRRGCIGYVTTCKLKVMDVRLFRAGIYAMWDGPVYFHDFVLQSVLEADTPVFFILMIDYALMTTAFRGKWPDTGRTLTRMLLLRRALVQMQFEMRTPILTMAAVNNPEMSGSLIGEISKTITEQPVYVEDPKQIMEQEIDCEEDRSKWLQMMNAMSAYFSSMLTEEKPPHSNTLTWAEESHFEKIADANFEFSRARQAGVKFLVKKFPGYFLVCHEWPQYSWDEYLEFIQTDELKEFKETAECAVADEANMHKPLQQKIKKLESIRDGQIENGLNIADTVALLSSAKAELAASRGFSVQMDPKLAYYYGHAPGFTCPDNWIDLLMDDTYPFHDVEGLDKKLEKRLENCDANVRKLIQTIKAETEKAQREHRQMLESRYCEFAQWNSIPEQLGADRYSSAKFLHLMRTNLSKTRHETSQDMYEDAFTILFLLMIKRANAVAAVKAGLDQPEMSMLERSEMNITGVGQNETQISELPASAIAEITNPNTNPEESSEQCNTAANGNVNDERISNPTITDVPQNEEPRAISSTHTAVSTLQMTEEETEAPVAETTSEKNKHAVEKKTKKGKKSAKVTREEPVVDNNDEEEQEAQPAKKKKKTDPTISRTMTLRKHHSDFVSEHSHSQLMTTQDLQSTHTRPQLESTPERETLTLENEQVRLHPRYRGFNFDDSTILNESIRPLNPETNERFSTSLNDMLTSFRNDSASRSSHNLRRQSNSVFATPSDTSQLSLCRSPNMDSITSEVDAHAIPKSVSKSTGNDDRNSTTNSTVSSRRNSYASTIDDSYEYMRFEGFPPVEDISITSREQERRLYEAMQVATKPQRFASRSKVMLPVFHSLYSNGWIQKIGGEAYYRIKSFTDEQAVQSPKEYPNREEVPEGRYTEYCAHPAIQAFYNKYKVNLARPNVESDWFDRYWLNVDLPVKPLDPQCFHFTCNYRYTAFDPQYCVSVVNDMIAFLHVDPKERSEEHKKQFSYFFRRLFCLTTVTPLEFLLHLIPPATTIQSGTIFYMYERKFLIPAMLHAMEGGFEEQEEFSVDRCEMQFILSMWLFRKSLATKEYPKHRRTD